jgi:heptosyltransferase-3
MMPRQKARASSRRVLVIFPGALGDLMCLLPALAAISGRHAGAAVELMARFELARLAAGRTVVARGHSIDAREVGALFTDETSIDPDARRFFADFDRIYSFFASDDPRFRARLAAATDAEVSFHPFRPGGDGHVSDAYLRSIDGGALQDEVRLEPTPDDLAAAARVLAESRCDSSSFAAIFPGSGSAAKNWPADKFAEFAARLRRNNLTPDGNRRLGCVVVLGPAEESLEPVFRESGIAVLKNLELATVAAIARLAAAFVGNDSGVSHLAAAVGTPGVVIFGPTDPARWRPLGRRIGVLARDSIDSIAVEEVADALAKFVA